MPYQLDSDVRIASRINQPLRIVYIDLRQHGPGCKVERRRIPGNRSFEYPVGKFLETETRWSTCMNERIRSFRDVDIDTQLIYVGKCEDWSATLAMPASALGSSRRNQARSLVDTNVATASADECPGICESPCDYSVERRDDLCITVHSLQCRNRGLRLTIFSIGHIDVLL